MNRYFLQQNINMIILSEKFTLDTFVITESEYNKFNNE